VHHTVATSEDQDTILFLLSAATLLVVVDSAIINVALPVIKVALHFTQDSLQWVLTSYLLAFGGFLMLGGRTADLYGRRRVLVAGLAGFSLCSLLTGFSVNAPMLIVMRGLQGLAAAFMAPSALAILLTIFEEGPARHRALSIWGVVTSGGGAVGVLLGGVLTQYLGWRWNFFVNVPIGGLSIWGIVRHVPAQIAEASDARLDVPGATLVTGGLMALVYALTLAARAGWSAASTIAAFAMSACLLIGFLINEARVEHPLVPLSIFRLRNVIGGNLMMLPIVAGALGLYFFTSLYVQEVLHYSPALTGLAFLPVPVVMGVVSCLAPPLLDRFGHKPVLAAGTALASPGSILMSYHGSQASYWTQLLPLFLVLAVGLGFAFVAITVAATSGVPADQAGLASGLINTSQQVGGALGLAVLAVVASATTARSLSGGGGHVAASLLGYQHAFLAAAALMAGAWVIGVVVIRSSREIVEVDAVRR
jgi:EmrB/QacA subfamily drug resistance transporter